MSNLGLTIDQFLAIAGIIAAIILAAIGFPGIYTKWQERKKEREFESQINSSIRDAEALQKSKEYLHAVNKYDGILNAISPKKYPNHGENARII